MFPHDGLETRPQSTKPNMTVAAICPNMVAAICPNMVAAICPNMAAAAITSLVLERTVTVSSVVVSFSWRALFRVSSSLHLFMKTHRGLLDTLDVAMFVPTWSVTGLDPPPSSSVRLPASKPCQHIQLSS